MEHLEDWLNRYERGLIDRRAFLAGAAVALKASLAGAAPAGFVAPGGIHHVEIKTLDLTKTTAFYEALLGPATVENERATIALNPGGARTDLRISRGPIPRMDHFAVRVPGMSPRDPKATRARLEKRGLKVRQVGPALYVMGPDDYEVELIAPTAR